jgi:hypothetical protein
MGLPYTEQSASTSQHSNIVQKLNHPLEEIRQRALKTLIQKLDLGFITVADLTVQLDLIKALLQVMGVRGNSGFQGFRK